jgi:hypothetical protein
VFVIDRPQQREDKKGLAKELRASKNAIVREHRVQFFSK